MVRNMVRGVERIGSGAAEPILRGGVLCERFGYKRLFSVHGSNPVGAAEPPKAAIAVCQVYRNRSLAVLVSSYKFCV